MSKKVKGLLAIIAIIIVTAAEIWPIVLIILGIYTAISIGLAFLIWFFKRERKSQRYEPVLISRLLVGIRNGVLNSQELVKILEIFRYDEAQMRLALKNIFLSSLEEGNYKHDVIESDPQLSAILDRVVDDTCEILIRRYDLIDEEMDELVGSFDDTSDEDTEELWGSSPDINNAIGSDDDDEFDWDEEDDHDFEEDELDLDEEDELDWEENDGKETKDQEKYFQEIVEIAKELFLLIYNRNVLDKIEMHSLKKRSLPSPSEVAKVSALIHKLSTLTGKTKEELFDNDFKGLLEIMEKIPEDILKNNKPGKQSLSDIIAKTNNLPEGIFANINNDLNNHIRDDHPPIIKMAYAYARRTAAAGLFLQGVFGMEHYNHASKIFKIIQMQTGHTVEFQEEAGRQACDLLHSYDSRITKNMVGLITAMVEHKQTPEQYNGKTYLSYETIILKLQQAINIGK